MNFFSIPAFKDGLVKISFLSDNNMLKKAKSYPAICNNKNLVHTGMQG